MKTVYIILLLVLLIATIGAYIALVVESQRRRLEEMQEDGDTVQPAQDLPLTEEEQYQLEKIKGVLQQAEDTARESGLLEEG